MSQYIYTNVHVYVGFWDEQIANYVSALTLS